jgi:hypothetical protein
MSIRFIAASLLAVVAAAPLAAQTGRLPAGWNARFDQAGSSLKDVEVRQAGTALAFRSGPTAAGIFWNTKDVATGSYTVSAVFNQEKSMQHEGYGLFVGGQNLADPTQSYLYMVLKPQSGTFLINHRAGNAAPKKLVAETATPAINRDAPGTGAAENAMAIRVARDSVYFYINGREVRAFPKSALPGVTTDGLAGLRVNHNLDIEVRDFGVKR